jgi:vacuolar-type H+-ATPase subunit H
MGSVVETTIKALVEFESALDGAKVEAVDSRSRLLKASAEWAEAAKARAVVEAEQIASDRLATARAEAEREADSIRKKGELSLKSFEASISKRRSQAAEYVVGRLLGERA